MITEKKFKSLISKNESSILDFKSEIYDFKTDKRKCPWLKTYIKHSNLFHHQKCALLLIKKTPDFSTP